MIGRRKDHSPTTRHDTSGVPSLTARGGVSFGAVLTGVVVAFGAMFMLTAVIAGVLVALGLSENLTPGQQADVGVATAIGLVAAQFLSYLWGGYTAGRMSRGAGAANGALVALVAIVAGVAVGAIAAGIGATEDLRTPFNSSQLPADGEVLSWGAGLAVAAVAAMFLGAVAGGVMGARWHRGLERHQLREHEGHTVAGTDEAGSGSDTRAEAIDLRERDRATSDRDHRVTQSDRRE